MKTDSKIFKVSVVPGSNSSGIELMEDGTLKVRVRSVPEKGKANKELIELISDYFRVSKSSVEIQMGRSGRQKLIKVHGIEKSGDKGR